jgi:dipeptidyl aminopeptidase/acylaminoacyl peptidase
MSCVSNTTAATVLLAIAAIALPSSGVGAQEPRPMTVEDVLALRSVGSVAMSPDGRWIAYVVTTRDFEQNTNDSDVWVVATDGAAPVQLSRSEASDNAPQWSPDGTWLAFRSSRGEKAQVYGIRPNGGESWQVTNSPTSVGAFRFSPDARHLAFVASQEQTDADKELEEQRGRRIVWDSSYAEDWSRLWVAPLDEQRRAGEAHMMSPDTLHVSTLVWSPDGDQIAFGARPSPVLRTHLKGAVYVADTSGNGLRQVTFMPGGEGPASWTSHAGLMVAGSAHELGTYNTRLWRVPLEGGEPVALTGGLDENAGYVQVTARALFVEATYRTGRRLYRIPLQDGTPQGPPVVVSDDQRFYSGFSVSDDGRLAGCIAEAPASPPDVYVTQTERFDPTRLTEVNPHVKELALGEHRVASWKSRADGEAIEGVLTLPVDYRAGTPVRLLLVIHGGPSGVSSNRFSATRGAYPIQVFAGLGYAVLQPNYRGSTGYGERFRGLNRGDISGRDWIDIDTGVDEMVRQGIADPERLGVMGWSFGGHHTYWGITQTDRYAAASAGAGANDLVSMYSQTDIPEFYHTYLGPKPWEDFDLYEQRSAYRYVERVTTPLLIQVGENDERVPAEQSIQFFEAVRAIGKAPTALVLYPGQPHGVRQPRLYRDLVSRNVEWFIRWIPSAREVSLER